MNFFGVGGMEALIILLVAFLALGPRQLRNAAKGLGKAIRELRQASSQFTRLVDDEDEPKPPRTPPQGPP